MSVPPGGRILLTGANGYLASVTISLFLERGYSVRGTVRSVAAHAWMKTYFGERFELVEVPNNMLQMHGVRRDYWMVCMASRIWLWIHPWTREIMPSLMIP